MEEDEILQLYELPFSDLVLLSSDCVNMSSPAELQRLGLVRTNVMEALGPMGPGLLSVSGVPNAAALRQDLSLARRLALLDADHRKRILKGHKLGSDVSLKNPWRNVSSFAMQLRYERDSNSEQDVVVGDRTMELKDDREYKNLGSNLKDLGFCMMELGLCLARVCDGAIGGQELEQSLLESCAAKGRLIHYHSAFDGRLLLKRAARIKGVNPRNERRNHSEPNADQTLSAGSDIQLWQQWHYDYGIFTVLTAPLFLLLQATEDEEDGFPESRHEECGYPSGHTCLQIFDPTKKRIFMVKASPESFIIQVGESAEVLSKGKLRATLHSVARPEKLENLSRETFVVFLQPAWDKLLCLLDYPTKCMSLGDQCLSLSTEQPNQRIEEIQKIVPSLSSRLKEGMTFAEFSRETTRQYYGGSGLQSNR